MAVRRHHSNSPCKTLPIFLDFLIYVSRNEINLRRCILTKTQKLIVGLKINQTRLTVTGFDVHGSVHHNINRIEITNKMRQCNRIYYFNVS